jgi:CubicO group peptidase (beta-lactamase class C family)
MPALTLVLREEVAFRSLAVAMGIVAVAAIGGDTAHLHGCPAGQQSWRLLGGGTRSATELDACLERLVSQPGITALSVAVVDGGRTVYARTVGVVDPRTRRLADERTVFRGASLSKPVFAYLVMRLVDEGVLDLDTPLVRYLPKPLAEYAAYESLRGDPRVDRLTAQLILSHRSGLPNWRRIRPDGPIRFGSEPGRDFGYSGEGYRLLQFVIENVTGKGLATLARDRVFAPMNMANTSFLWEPRFDGRFAVELNSGLGGLIRQTRLAGNAAGSLVTDASDYARFLAAVLNGEGLSTQSYAAILQPEVELTSKSLFSPPGTDRGANRHVHLAWTPGWGTFADTYGRAVFHVGREEGCENYVEAHLDRGLGIVILSLSTSRDSFTAALVGYAIGRGFRPLAWLEYGQRILPAHATSVLRWALAGLALMILVLVVRRAGWIPKRVPWR